MSRSSALGRLFFYDYPFKDGSGWIAGAVRKIGCGLWVVVVEVGEEEEGKELHSKQGKELQEQGKELHSKL